MIAFRECLANDLVPFIVVDSDKSRYYDGLQRFEEDKGVLQGFFEEMAALYLEEYQSLIPPYLLIGSNTEADLDADMGSTKP